MQGRNTPSWLRAIPPVTRNLLIINILIWLVELIPGFQSVLLRRLALHFWGRLQPGSVGDLLLPPRPRFDYPYRFQYVHPVDVRQAHGTGMGFETILHILFRLRHRSGLGAGISVAVHLDA